MRTHTCMQAHTHARTHTPSPPSPQTEQPKQRHKRHCAVCALRPAPASGTHVVEHGGPPFHGDALEDGQHRKKDVIELRDPVVRADPVLAFIAGWAALHTARVRGVESFQDTCGHIRRVRGKPQGVQRELERASGSAQVCFPQRDLSFVSGSFPSLASLHLTDHVFNPFFSGNGGSQPHGPPLCTGHALNHHLSTRTGSHGQV